MKNINLYDSAAVAEQPSPSRHAGRFPSSVDSDEAVAYGFYAHEHRYYVCRRLSGGEIWTPISNFTIDVKYHIAGANPKRICEITNVHGRKTTIDFTISELVSLEKFKTAVESAGNYLFEGSAGDLGKIKNKLYSTEKPSIEINRLGQYKEHWVWANGIYSKGTFHPMDETGIVQLREKEQDMHYFIPVMGSTTAQDNDDLRNYRRFIHKPTDIGFSQWCDLMISVYGDNAKTGIAFALFAMYSDIVFEVTHGAPMLFLFGQRSSGKGTFTTSLLSLFGMAQDQIMLGGQSTVVGFMRKMSQFANAIVWLDEYKNDIDPKKIESLKNIWDRVGYERGVKDQSNRTQSTPITSSAILSGQEVPNVEPALFSRTILLSFKNKQYSPEDVASFNILRKIEQAGLTTATHTAISHRELVKKDFRAAFDEIAQILRANFINQEINERQLSNYATLIAMVKVLQEPLALPFTYIDLLKLGEINITAQAEMGARSNEVQQFFEMVLYLASIHLIEFGSDWWIDKSGKLKMRLQKVYPLYREHSKKQGMRTIDNGTLRSYLSESEHYDEKQSKIPGHYFPGLTTTSRAMVFNSDKHGLIHGVNFAEALSLSDKEKKDNPYTEPAPAVELTSTESLPS